MEFLDHDEHHNMVSHPENSEEFAGLTVNSGVAEPPKVNPYFHPRKRRRTMTAGEYVEAHPQGRRDCAEPSGDACGESGARASGIGSGSDRKVRFRRQATRAASASPECRVPARVRRSTSSDCMCLKTAANSPFSPSTRAASAPKAVSSATRPAWRNCRFIPKRFIRPSPSAGSLGGVARKTRESIVLCEAAGFNNIFVETVGVGQSETAVHSMVDFFLLIQLAGTGDELQGIKRGIMEMADGIVINKADGDNIERANLAKAQFQSALHLFPPTLSGWIPEVLTYSGYYGIGIKEVWEMIDRYFEFVKGNGYFEHRRMEQEKYWMYETIDEQLKAHFYRDPEVEALLKVKQDNVLAARQSSFVAAKDVLDYYFQKMGLK